jgi:alpha-L-fucosidase 2
VLQVFPAWPKDWSAEYRLLAPGAFLVTSAQRDGRVEFVELQSQAGAPARLRNPWGSAGVTLYRDGKKAQDLDGELLAFPTRKGEDIVVAPKGTALDALRRGI